MRTFCTIILLAAVGLGVLGYVRGWYTVVTSDEKIDISIDRKKVEADSEEFRTKTQQTIDEYRRPSGETAPTGDTNPGQQPGQQQPGQQQPGQPRPPGPPPPPGGQALPRK